MVIHVCCWTDADHHGCCERHREWSLLASDSLLRLMRYQHKGEAPPHGSSPPLGIILPNREDLSHAESPKTCGGCFGCVIEDFYRMRGFSKQARQAAPYIVRPSTVRAWTAALVVNRINHPCLADSSPSGRGFLEYRTGVILCEL